MVLTKKDGRQYTKINMKYKKMLLFINSVI